MLKTQVPSSPICKKEIKSLHGYNPINNWTNMSWNCTAYFSDARALLLTERVIAHACSFNYWSDYSSQRTCAEIHAIHSSVTERDTERDSVTFAGFALQHTFLSDVHVSSLIHRLQQVQCIDLLIGLLLLLQDSRHKSSVIEQTWLLQCQRRQNMVSKDAAGQFIIIIKVILRLWASCL